MVHRTKPINGARVGQVMECLRTGTTSNKAIGKRLGLSDHTVNDYVKQAFSATQTKNRVELAVYAEREFWKAKSKLQGANGPESAATAAADGRVGQTAEGADSLLRTQS